MLKERMMNPWFGKPGIAAYYRFSSNLCLLLIHVRRTKTMKEKLQTGKMKWQEEIAAFPGWYLWKFQALESQVGIKALLIIWIKVHYCVENLHADVIFELPPVGSVMIERSVSLETWKFTHSVSRFSLFVWHLEYSELFVHSKLYSLPDINNPYIPQAIIYYDLIIYFPFAHIKQ